MGTGSQVLVLVDVAGHGLGAALVAASISGQLREMVGRHPLAEVAHQLNNQLCRENDGKYACLAVVSLQEQRAVVVNAGLPPVCLIREGACVARFDRSGYPPGLAADASYGAYTCDVRPGDRLALMSDGLTEPFGHATSVEPVLHRLDLLSRDLHIDQLTPTVLGDRMTALLRDGHPVDVDDATLLIAERLPVH